MRAHGGPDLRRRLRSLPPILPSPPELPVEGGGLAFVLLLMLPGVVLAGVLAAHGSDPLILVGAALGVAAVVALWRRPTLALNVLLFVVLLPQGLLPGAVTSVLVLFLTGLNVAVRLRDRPLVSPAQAHLVP